MNWITNKKDMNLNEYTFENVECQTIMLNQKREKIK